GRWSRGRLGRGLGLRRGVEHSAQHIVLTRPITGAFPVHGLLSGWHDDCIVPKRPRMTREEFIAYVDSVLLAQKSIPGIDEPTHFELGTFRNEYVLKLPVEINGVLGPEKIIVAYRPSAHIDYSISLVCNVSVCRLDYDEAGGHTNSMLASRFRIPLIVSGPHFHKWEYNKQFVENDTKLLELKNAVEVRGIRSFDSALRWFCGEVNVHLPHNHSIALPTDRLL
ncbi:hypothetical protein, partial [Ottowia flava]